MKNQKKHIQIHLTPKKSEIDRMRSGINRGIAPEIIYSNMIPLAHRKSHAQFFTPPKIAKLMAEWAITSTSKNILDPAIGMGILVRAALDKNPNIQITAFENDPLILKLFLTTFPDLSKIQVFFSDFLLNNLISKYDSILMNPPYLRHHDLKYNFDIFSYFEKKYEIKISKLSNSYFLFTLKALDSLNLGGRASIIIPTEWMNANFGFAMKKFLLERNFLKEIVYFSNCSEIFDNALTTSCILFLERPF